ncbi:uncharacterized protein MONOS_17081 [Monocercomonoides exilis]|nr:hypothetical protein MONOS_17081 [Monocercomonoides exilis]
MMKNEVGRSKGGRSREGRRGKEERGAGKRGKGPEGRRMWEEVVEAESGRSRPLKEWWRQVCVEMEGAGVGWEREAEAEQERERAKERERQKKKNERKRDGKGLMERDMSSTSVVMQNSPLREGGGGGAGQLQLLARSARLVIGSERGGAEEGRDGERSGECGWPSFFTAAFSLAEADGEGAGEQSGFEAMHASTTAELVCGEASGLLFGDGEFVPCFLFEFCLRRGMLSVAAELARQCPAVGEAVGTTMWIGMRQACSSEGSESNRAEYVRRMQGMVDVVSSNGGGRWESEQSGRRRWLRRFAGRVLPPLRCFYKSRNGRGISVESEGRDKRSEENVQLTKVMEVLRRKIDEGGVEDMTESFVIKLEAEKEVIV